MVQNMVEDLIEHGSRESGETVEWKLARSLHYIATSADMHKCIRRV